MQLGEQRRVGPIAGADPLEVEHDRLARAGLGEVREGVDRGGAAQRGVGRDQPPAAQVEAEHERGAGQVGLEPAERVRAGQRLGADHDPRDTELKESLDRRRRRGPGVDADARFARQRGDDARVRRATSDRVEVGDVELVDAEALAHGARQLHGVRPLGDPAAQRAVAFAIPADRVHRDAALEIDDRDHSHDREASPMPGVIGLDVGGVNTKAVWRDGDAVRTVLRPHDVVREPGALTAVVRGVVAELSASPPELVALTMTAELSDEFRTKREGVAFVLDAVSAAVAGRVLAFTAAGELVSLEEARARPLDVAAANWVASALAVGAVHPDALMLDVGSTTADVIPIAGGRVAAEGRTDLGRLLAGELVYTGALRTNLAAIAPRVPVRGRWCPVASELFAISGDVHLILGHLAPEAYTCPTPDGRAATVECARERVVRLVCADTEQLGAAEIEAIAAFLAGEQVRQIEAAVRQVGTDAAIVPLGVGAFLGRAVAERSAARCSSCPGARSSATPRRRRRSPTSRRACADRRQGRRRARTGVRRRCAARALRRARGGGHAPPAARRAGRRGVRGRGPLARRPVRAGGAERAPDGDPRDGPVRLGARRPHAGRDPLRRPRAAARRRRLGAAARRAARGARPAARVLDRDLGLDRRLGGRRCGRLAAGVAEAGPGPLPHMAAGGRADRAAHR